MNASRKQQLDQQLRALLASTPEIEGAALVSDDGLIIASVLAPPAEEDRVAAMSAALLSLGERIARELGRGTLEQVYIKGNQGFALLTAANARTVLTIMASNEARLGLLLLELRKAVNDLQRLL
ncbi:MAG: roadblock/LC7 domain-containing protein [Anaerolineales bacterium]|jgi:predicted regulator of Ras-like GTPase activity (Roadblock/LC7/MglB family)|nr:roadblock/LC7 domain-containing protein [Anaerolineales bacterium]MBX3005765.1 roadblock/LC7 domain-containing protein [Anaerolineales bacterium]